MLSFSCTAQERAFYFESTLKHFLHYEIASKTQKTLLYIASSGKHNSQLKNHGNVSPATLCLVEKVWGVLFIKRYHKQ